MKQQHKDFLQKFAGTTTAIQLAEYLKDKLTDFADVRNIKEKTPEAVMARALASDLLQSVIDDFTTSKPSKTIASDYE